MPRVCLFDVNETLLDLRALDPLFADRFGDAAVRAQWFAQMLQSALVATVTDAYRDFGALGQSSLDMLGARLGVPVSDEDKAELGRAMRTLPAHPEVAEGLARLRDAGVRLATLTNSTQAVAEAQLEHAGLTGFFERILSADTVRRLKPAPEPYRMAADELGVQPAQIRLVAAHAWDVTGAIRAGCAAAFIGRPGVVLDPLGETPDIVGADLTEVSTAILDRED